MAAMAMTNTMRKVISVMITSLLYKPLFYPGSGIRVFFKSKYSDN